jgi:hypothetical protein
VFKSEERFTSLSTLVEIKDTRGKTSILDTAGTSLDGLEVTSITSEGDLHTTNAEVANEEYILHILQNKQTLLNNPWSKSIYGNAEDVKWPPLPSKPAYLPPPILVDPERPLNASQENVVTSMLSSPASNQILIVQGPPGTGKVRIDLVSVHDPSDPPVQTSVIAAYVNSATDAGQKGIWLIAQSNIAVKNIAEKLLKTQFTNFKILVSRDFHEGWLALLLLDLSYS